MENLLIFGDSFAVPHDRTQFEYTWPNRLRKNFVTQNFSVVGTGPDFSLQKFLTVDKRVRNKDKTSIIFCLSSITRFNFAFLKAEHQIVVNHILKPNIPTKLQEITNKYLKFKLFIEKFFKDYIYNSTYLETELIKIILLLKYLTKDYKKTIVLPCFDEVTQNLFDFTKSNNFFVYKDALIQYNKLDVEVDYRPNHMDEDHHKEFYNYILTLLRSNNE